MKRTGRSLRGIALVGALAMLLFVSLVAVALYAMVQDELARTRGLLETTRARQACRSGMARMLAAMDRAKTIPAAPLSGRIAGVAFLCRAETVRPQDYAKIRPDLPASLVRITCLAGRAVATATGETITPVARTVVLVDSAKSPPGVLTVAPAAVGD